MKQQNNMLLAFCILLLSALFLNSCDDYDVKGDNSFYDNITISVVGAEDGILSVNLFNEQQIALKVSNEDVVFDMKAFIYTVEDESFFDLDKSGNIKPIKEGESKVSMVFRANDKVKTDFIVRIWKDPIFVERISVPANLEMKENSTYNLGAVASVVPGNADNPKLAYESLTPNIVTVDENGIITSLTEGKGQIKVSATDGTDVSATVTVNVVAEILVTEFRIPPAINGRTVGVGQTFNLGSQITVLPANADNRQLEYTILSGVSVISIDAEGLITTLSPGTAVIKISTTDGTDITQEIELNVDNNPLVDRAIWGVTTQTATDYGFVVDGSTGKPEDLFDDLGNTFLSLVKPGKSYGSVPSQPTDFIPSFTVDMQSEQTFNYFIWQHRQGNNNNFLRVYGIKMEGSNDGENFTPINGGELIWIPNVGGYVGTATPADSKTYEISIEESSYQYIKVKLAMWSDIYKSDHPDYPGNGATGGSSMQVAEFGVGRK